MAHFKALLEVLQADEVHAHLDMRTFELQLIVAGQVVRWLPQFTEFKDGKVRYTPKFDANVLGFIGWRPYFNRQWPQGVHKLSFKQAIAGVMNTPPFWLKPSGVLRNVLIKRSKSTFGEHLRGPFAEIDVNHLPAGLGPLQDGDYFESFISGTIVKLWCYGKQPVCLHVRETPKVIGDGKHTLGALVDARLHELGIDLDSDSNEKNLNPLDVSLDHNPKERIHLFLEFQGLSLEWIVPEGMPVTIDYLYGSRCFADEPSHNLNAWPDGMGLGVNAHIEQAARHFAAMLPDNFQHDTLYSVDGVLDANGDMWWLEMNCNPMTPPECYAHMVKAAIAPAGIELNIKI